MKELRKKALILSLSGFLLGVLIGIAFLVIPDDGSLKNEGIVGKILYLMTCGIYGALAWGSSVIYEIESWSILRCTVTHGLITFGGLTVFFGVLVVAGWMKKPSLGAALIIFTVSFGFRRVDQFFNAMLIRGITFVSLTFYCFAKGYVFFTGANGLENHVPKGIPGAILSGGLILPLDIAVGFVVACTMFGFFSLFRRGSIGGVWKSTDK